MKKSISKQLSSKCEHRQMRCRQQFVMLMGTVMLYVVILVDSWYAVCHQNRQWWWTVGAV